MAASLAPSSPPTSPAIEAAPVASPSAEVPAAGVENEVDISPCPMCKTELSVVESALGSPVECPNCLTLFVAERLRRATPVAVISANKSAPPPPPPRSKGKPSDDNAPTFKMKPGDDDDDDDDEPRRRRRQRPDTAEERPRLRPRRAPRRSYEPCNLTGCIIFAVLGWVCCALLFFVGRSRCEEELARIDDGRVDPNYRIAVVACLWICNVGIIVWVVAVILGFILRIMAIGDN